MSNIATAINSGAERLANAGVPEPRREASSLLRYILDRDAAFLIAHPEYVLTGAESGKYEDAIRRREQREPFQLIVGRQEFYRLGFEVEAGVLIPRPETEILVERAVDILGKVDKPKILEIGVGTGCISISILNSMKTATAVGVDISDQALDLAARNSKELGVADRLELLCSDLFEQVGERRFDMIVSNPPYVPVGDRESLQPEVVQYDPHAALFGGEEGLDVIRRIAADAPAHLATDGYLLMEIGHGLAESVKELFGSGPWKDVELINDLQGIERTLVARLAA